jgi:hypothetical protein
VEFFNSLFTSLQTMNMFTRHSLQVFFCAVTAMGLSTFTTSCTKDEQAVTPANTPACLLTAMSYKEDTQTLEYDSKSRVNKMASSENYLTVEYDNNNRAVKMLRYDMDGILTETIMIEYNTQGQWIKSTSIDPEDASTTVSTAEYDSNGNRIKVTGDNSVTTYEYADGNLIKSIDKYGSNTKTTSYEYYTDKDNKLNIIQELFNIGYGATPSKNLLKKEMYNSSGTGRTYTYEFNEKGFPTKMTTTTTGDINNDNKVDADDVDIDVYTQSYQCK